MGQLRSRSLSLERAQAGIEYIITYSWVIVLMIVAVILLFLFSGHSSTVVPSTCSFVDGAYCQQIVLGTNSITHATKLALLLNNRQTYPIVDPVLTVRLNNINTSVACSPSFVLNGGAILCVIDLPVQASLGQLISGTIYLTANYCGVSGVYLAGGNCTDAPRQTYLGNFNAHAEPIVSPTATITLTAASGIEIPDNSKDQLNAVVKLLGYPLRGATVNFTVNVSGYNLAPNLTTADSSGTALSYIWGTIPGTVKVTATYAGINASTVILFTANAGIFYVVRGFDDCVSASNIIGSVDGAAKTCSQLSGTFYPYSAGSTSTYSFATSLQDITGARAIFKNITILGINYMNPIGSTKVITTETAIVNYRMQYYLNEVASPNNTGFVFPGSGWFWNGTKVKISEIPVLLYALRNWTCSGAGCYSGTLQSIIITMSNPINETAHFFNTTVITSYFTDIWVGNAGQHQISIINGTNDLVSNTIPNIGNNQAGVAISPDGKFAYIAAKGSRTINVIDVGTRTVVTTVNLIGNSPTGVVVTPDNRYLYISMLASAEVQVMDTRTYQIVKIIPVGSTPEGVSVTPDGAYVYVAVNGLNTVVVINTTTNTMIFQFRNLKVPEISIPFKLLFTSININ